MAGGKLAIEATRDPLLCGIGADIVVDALAGELGE